MYEESARLAKAMKIADFLQFEVGIKNIADVGRMKPFQWKLAAQGAKVKLSRNGDVSEETRQKVMDILEGRERVTGNGLVLDRWFRVRQPGVPR